MELLLSAKLSKAQMKSLADSNIGEYSFYKA